MNAASYTSAGDAKTSTTQNPL